MIIERVFTLINNLDVREKFLKFAPQWSTVVVDVDGTVVDVIRHREAPNIKLHKEHMDMYPESVQFTAKVGMYESIDELKEMIRSCVEVHKKY